MELKKLYDIAEKENIDIINFKMKNKAIIGCLNNNYAIGLNYSIIDNSHEEKTILGEELGHYYSNSLYNQNFSKLEIDKRETRALKWAYSVLIPFQKLTEKLKQGLNLYELADYFDVEVKYMVNCIDFYIGKYGQITV